MDDKPQKYTMEQRVSDAWRSVLNSRQGRLVIKEILSNSHYGLSAYSGDPHLTHVMAGKQMVGEYVMQNINCILPEAYFLMIKEQKEYEDYDRQQQSDTNNGSNTDGGYTF